MEKELELLEEFLLLEEKKLEENNLPEADRKNTEERIAGLIKIMKVVNSAERALTDTDKRRLACVVERLMNESASAHLKTDADGKIEVTVYDTIYRPKIFAKLEMQKVFNHLVFTGCSYYQ